MMSFGKKNQQVVLTSIIFIFCFSLLVISSLIPVISHDSFWHLKMGLDFINKGLSPFVDHYSFTFSGQPITDVPYLFQIIQASFVSIFGLTTGSQLLRIFAFSLLLSALYKFFKYIKAPWPIIALTLPFIVVFSQMRILIRPELFDYPLMVLALLLYLKAKAAFSNKNLGYITLLLIFWANYHAVILGYIIFFGLFLDKAIAKISRQEKNLSWQRWLTWGLIIFMAGFLNPEFKHSFFSILNFSNEWKDMVKELTPTLEMRNYKDYYVLWLVSLYLFFALLKQKQYGFALICAIFAFQSSQMVRFVTPAGIIIISLLAFSLTKIYHTQFFNNTKTSIKGLIIFSGVIAVIIAMNKSINIIEVNNNFSKTKQYPKATADYLKKSYPQGGNILNDYNYGGYLIYKLAPEFKIYIDGRSNILYSFDFTKYATENLLTGNSQLLSQEIDKYNIKYVLMPLNQQNFWLFHRVKKMHIEFVGNNFILFTSQKNNFPISTGLMMFPMCWDEKYKPAISREAKIGKQILSNDSVLAPVLISLDKIGQVDNYNLFFDSLDMEQLSNEQKRILAYIALKSGLNGHAFNLFAKMSNKKNLELLMMALAAINEKEFSAAENVLLHTSIEYLLEEKTTIHEKAIIITLYGKMGVNYTLQTKSNEYLSQLNKELIEEEYPYALPLQNIVSHSYCNEIFTEYVVQ